jgi:DNA repair protein RadD
VLVLTHVKELLQQLAETVQRIWPTQDLGRPPVGIYSAGLGRRETSDPVIIAGIQSVFRRGTELGRFDLVLVDEAHLIPRDGDGMYLSLLKDLCVINPNLRLIGLTATPYRLDSGWLYGEGALFSGVAYDAQVRDLIDQGYLSPLRGKDGGKPDLAEVHVRGGEYVGAELEAAMSDEQKIEAACADMVKYGSNRQAWLIFCCGVKHAALVSAALVKHGVNAPLITGETPADERAELVRAFKARELRALVNVQVLTTGFDAPQVDLVALLRPTLSPGLYYQMVGRGLRKFMDKTDCLVLDFGGNIYRHGPVDNIVVADKAKRSGEPGEAPTKTCSQCNEIVLAAARQCNCCGFEFPKPELKHEAKSAQVSPLTEFSEQLVDVIEVDWTVHTKKDAQPGTPRTLRVIYTYGFHQSVSEWICVEHTGFARNKAEAWWGNHTAPGSPFAPANADEACKELVRLDALGHLRLPVKLTLRLGGKWPEIVGKEFAQAREPGADEAEPAFATPAAQADDADLPPF